MGTQKPVLVVGTGPVGCVTALILSKAGVPVTILEAEDDLIMDMRGSTFHPPTLDMLDDLGVTPQMIEQGLITPMLQYRDLDDGLIAEFDHGMLTDYTRHPYRLQCEQFKLTRIIVDMLADYPDANLIFNATVVEIDQSADGVTATYETPDGTQSIEGSYRWDATAPAALCANPRTSRSKVSPTQNTLSPSARLCPSTASSRIWAASPISPTLTNGVP